MLAMPDSGRQPYDLCVLGCGSAGFAAAMRALDLGKDVCVVENGQIGGAGVMWGALASKTMWELSKDYAVARKKDRGYRAAGLAVNFSAVRGTVTQAVSEKQNQMRTQLKAFAPQNYPGPGSITYKTGAGAFLSPGQVAVTNKHGRREVISAKYFLIATGSSPKRLPGTEVDQKQIFDSDGILRMKAFPKRLMIIGAGIVGCEYATIFSNFAQTKVILVDHMKSIIPYEDEDISRFVSENLTKSGVRIYHSAQLKDIVRRAGTLTVTLELPGGRLEKVQVDAVLISIGRQPNLSGLNLESLSITPGAHGDLEPDRHCRVKKNIYAAGDVTVYPDLVNIAEMEGRYAVKHMFGIRQRPLSYHNMSTVMFFYPAVGAVGLNEKNCRQQRIPYRVAFYAHALLPRAIAMRALNGFVKIIVSDDDRQQILGMRAAGPQVSNNIVSIAYLMDERRGIQHVLRSVHPHPTLSEGIQECLRMLSGESIYKPRAFPQYMKISTWHPDKGDAAVHF